MPAGDFHVFEVIVDQFEYYEDREGFHQQYPANVNLDLNRMTPRRARKLAALLMQAADIVDGKSGSVPS